MQTSDKMKAVVFDLDGTLLDTTKDIGLALERTLDTHFTDEQVNRFVGRGLKNALIAAAQEKGLVGPDIDALNERLLYFYRQTPVLHTKPYPTVMDAIGMLSVKNIPICVFSNKEQDLAETVVHTCFPDVEFTMIVGMHGKYEGKPSPQAVEAFCENVGLPKESVLYVGDSEVDFKTAVNSKVPYRILTYGTRTKEALLGSGVPEENLIPDMSSLKDLF